MTCNNNSGKGGPGKWVGSGKWWWSAANAISVSGHNFV